MSPHLKNAGYKGKKIVNKYLMQHYTSKIMQFLCLAMLPLDLSISNTVQFYIKISVKYISIGELLAALGVLLCGRWRLHACGVYRRK
jgi:hypothetical protein